MPSPRQGVQLRLVRTHHKVQSTRQVPRRVARSQGTLQISEDIEGNATIHHVYLSNNPICTIIAIFSLVPSDIGSAEGEHKNQNSR